MAVYKQTYRGYHGALTPPRSRFLVLYRHALRSIFQSKLLLGFYIVCFLFPLIDLMVIYLAENTAFLQRLSIHTFFAVNRSFFFTFAHYQAFMAFLFTAFAAPGLIAPDLAHGGLALYLARPFSRGEYLFGKITALWALLSGLTWIPGLVLFAVQCAIGGAAWRGQNLWIGPSLVAACWVWILVVSLLALALSAWVKWRIVAGAALLGIYFFGAGLGSAVNFVLRTQYGSLFDFMELHLIVWAGMFRLAPPPLGLEYGAWAVLAGVALLSLALILRKVRPLEVVK